MIPSYEFELLLLAEVEAMEEAVAGNIVTGYDILLAGLERARDTVAREERGAADLLTQYQKALVRYAERYGVRLDS